MGQLRIIGGRWKRTPIPVLEVDGLRPTPDRVRETLFNWLGPNLSGWRCLDLFAGSGSLSFEAVSRGAAMALLLDRDAKACALIQSLIDKLKAGDQMQAIRADAVQWLDSQHKKGISDPFDLIFLDPPFGSNLLMQTLEKAASWLSEQGLVYLESGQALAQGQAEPLGLEVFRADKAGAVHYHLLRRTHKRGEHDADCSLSRDL
jgi:16S rRNA (guanine966-N2)-methyltransferase